MTDIVTNLMGGIMGGILACIVIPFIRNTIQKRQRKSVDTVQEGVDRDMKKDGKGFSTKDVIMIVLVRTGTDRADIVVEAIRQNREGRTGTAEPDAGRD